MTIYERTIAKLLMNDKLKEYDVINLKILNIKTTDNYLQWSNSGKMQNSQAERAYYIDNDCMCTLSSCNNNGDKSQIVEAQKDSLVCVKNE